ncbi:MAG TPA: long-chain fatty acid--CoA ligase [Aggregatilineales bacterium]|nr:long-chain fatty acid--CoA ligase [Aggregatilineales bacterium]
MVTYADRPWTKSYDEGVPHSLEPYPEIPLYALLDDAAKNHGDRVACIVSLELPVVGRIYNEVSYRELGELSDRLAAALADMGVKKGDRVAVDLVNSAQFAIAFFGILKAGGIVVALNPTFPPAQKARQIVDAGAEVAIVMSLFYEGLNSVRERTPLRRLIVTNIKEYFPGLGKFLFTVAREKKDGHRVEQLREGDVWLQDLLTKYLPSQRPKVDIKPKEDTAIFQFTGGTTGIPKAARSPHSALVNNAIQMRCWLAGDQSGEERFLAAIPLFHVYGMVAVMTFAVSMASAMIMVPNARDIDDVLGCIDRFKPTIFMGVPALYNAINNHPGVAAGKYDLSSIRACISGSAPLAPETKCRFEELTGGTVMEGFGMSEAPTATHCNPLRGENRVGSIGLPFPDVECRIVSLDDEVTDVPVGEIGELVLRGPAMMTGYHNQPTETANALRDGWLYTGDIARMDEDGYFYIVDRKKDMVLVGGFNVYPNEVEKVLMDHPAIAEAAVAGIPHPEKEGQEALKAWIVLKQGHSATEQEIIDFCAEQLAPYAVPRRLAFVEALPRTAVGKILRRELVNMEVEQQQQGVSSGAATA